MGAKSATILLAGCLLVAGCLGAAGTDDDPGESTATASVDPDQAPGSQPNQATTEAGGDMPPPSQRFPSATRADLANLTTEAWFIMESQASPEAPITAFQWEVPPGGVLEIELFEDRKDTTVPIEVTPVIPDGVDLEAWAFMAFTEHEDGLARMFSYTSVPAQGSSRSLTDSSGFETTVSPEPFGTYLGLSDLEVGDRVWFLSVARASQPATIATNLRVLDEDPWDDGYASPSSFKEAEARASDLPRLALPVTGEGQGFHQASYVEAAYLSTEPRSYSYRTPTVTVEESLPAEATSAPAWARSTTLSSSYESSTGWSASHSSFYTSTGAASWSIEAAARDQAVSASSTTANVWPAAATYDLLGVPAHYLVGDGQGPASVTVQVDATSANEFAWLSMGQTDLGTSLEALTGMPARELSFTYTGQLGSDPVELLSLRDGGLHRVSSLYGVDVIDLPGTPGASPSNGP